MMIRLVILICVSVALSSALPADAVAQSLEGSPGSTCTTGPTYNIPTNINVVTTIVNNISCVLYGQSPDGCATSANVAQTLFTGITGQGTFQFVVKAVATLFILIFGISFMLGIIQLTIIEFLIRVIKLSIVLFLLTGGAWNFFYQTIGVFFQNGTNWLIGESSRIALGTVPGIDLSTPFAQIDYAIATAFSAKMFVTIIAMLITGPYGWLFAILVIMGLGSFVGALFQAVWIYLMSMVVRAFLFGLAPIFFMFLLFGRTRHLFDGWLNQLVNSMLQPVLLFTFFSFFVVLVQAGMDNILNVKICFMPGVGIFDGAPNDLVLPRPTIFGAPYGGAWTWTGPEDCPQEECPIFFINIIDILIFLLLTQLAWRFNSIAINIAKEIAGVSTDLNIHGAFSHLLAPGRASGRRFANDARFVNTEDANFRLAQSAATAGGGAKDAAGAGLLGKR